MLKTDEDIQFVDKPWGYERIWADTEHYVGKYLFIKAGHSLSRQFHKVKDETVYVLAGPLVVETGPEHPEDEVRQIGVIEGESLRIHPGMVHRFCATAGADVELIEVSTNHLDDVVRIEDDYGRVPNFSA